jgi:hypothetical protein
LAQCERCSKSLTLLTRIGEKFRGFFDTPSSSARRSTCTGGGQDGALAAICKQIYPLHPARRRADARCQRATSTSSAMGPAETRNVTPPGMRREAWSGPPALVLISVGAYTQTDTWSPISISQFPESRADKSQWVPFSVRPPDKISTVVVTKIFRGPKFSRRSRGKQERKAAMV